VVYQSIQEVLGFQMNKAISAMLQNLHQLNKLPMIRVFGFQLGFLFVPVAFTLVRLSPTAMQSEYKFIWLRRIQKIIIILAND